MSDEISPKQGKLYIVSTPIGNYDDITLRAIKALQTCSLVVCEEIKCGSQLLHKLNINKKLEALNEQNELEKTPELFKMLLEGADIALISDHGTPLLADPGLQLVKSAIKKDIEIEVVPGVSSIMTALVRSGFSLEGFVYAGFLSRDRTERQMQLKMLAKEAKTVALLETPYRLMPLLEAAAEVMPKRQAYIGANLTMHYETHHYGSFSELFEKFRDQKFKGEFVICFDGASYSYDSYNSDEKEFHAYNNERRKFDGKRRFDRGKDTGGFRRERNYSDKRSGDDFGYRKDRDSGNYRRSDDYGDNRRERDTNNYRRSGDSGEFRRERDTNNYRRSEDSGGFRRERDSSSYRKRDDSGWKTDSKPSYRKRDDSGWKSDSKPSYRRREGGFGDDNREKAPYRASSAKGSDFKSVKGRFAGKAEGSPKKFDKKKNDSKRAPKKNFSRPR